MIESKHSLLGPIALLLDPYGRQARLYPALIVILPIALLIGTWFPALWSTWAALVSLASSFGLILLLSQVARDRGKQGEPELYRTWGGKPSVAVLRLATRREARSILQAARKVIEDARSSRAPAQVWGAAAGR